MSDSSGEEENIFGFESDHLALRGNRDYANVLRTIAILEVQRMRVHQQLEELELAKQRYTEDPELLLRKLRNNEEIISPNYMAIAKLPEVGNYDNLPKPDAEVKVETDTEVKTPTVRGRLVDDTKSGTFNRLWSCEEQRRLEQLLIEYPAEPIESHRYVKIAKALGNRTPQQVCSRVQKYFLKLHDAGLPIPGRRPKNRRGGQPKMKHLYRPTTFFPAYNVPVHMPEEDFVFSDLHSVSSPATPEPSGAHNSDTGSTTEGAVEAVVTQTGEERERTLRILRLILEEKEKTTDGYNPDPLAGSCELCNLAAISRSRWRCNTCYIPLNQCSDCLVNQLLAQKFEHVMHDVVAENQL